MNDALSRFVHDALSRGHDKEEIRTRLLEAHWSVDTVDQSLASYADIDFAVPVPRPKPYLSAREAFTYLVVFSTLYASAISLGSLLFLFIEHFLPDPAMTNWRGTMLNGIRWATSWLIISFPVFLWLSRRSYVAIRRDPEKRASKIRKWLTYFTLFIAAGVLIGDLVTLVFNLLAGELTLRFVLKVGVIGLIAGAVFGYYTWDLRQDETGHGGEARRSHPRMRLFAGGVTGSVVVAVIAGLFVAGSPGKARAERLDDRREGDLAVIAAAVDRFWIEQERLPEDLEELANHRLTKVRSIQDPETRRLYEFRARSDSGYQLCAVFQATDPDREPDLREYAARGDRRFWKHEVGHHCFDIEVSAESRQAAD